MRWLALYIRTWHAGGKTKGFPDRFLQRSDQVSKQYSSGLAIATGLCATMLALAACNQQQSPNVANAPASSASSAAGQQQAAAYTPPTADQLYQMVAPIALFPDKLVAQVLAGSTYPDQITAAENLLTQNPNLKGDLLQAAVEPQSWDASVKGLTQFPTVLSQMAQNIPWTTALGEAYVNDPTDVLNAIQVMRQRASAQGNLRSSAQQQVSTQPVQQVAQSEDASGYAEGGTPVYSGPDVVPPPTQIIQIEPAQPDAVYVPSYDPQSVYGGEVPYYPSYQYEQPSYSTGEVVAVGAVAFGAAIVLGAMIDNNRGGGWHSWGMNWGGGGGGYNGGGRYHPAVVYNNQTYVSRSTTVVNRYTNVTNNNITNNRYNRVNTATNNVANNTINNRNQFNRNVTNNVTNNTQRPTQPMSEPNFARAGYPSAAPHAAAEARPAAAAPPQASRPNAVHQQPNQGAAARPAFAPRPQQEAVRQPAQAARPAPQAQARPQPHAAPRPTPQQARPQPAARPAQQQQRPQAAAPQAHPQAAPRPAPQARPAPPPRPQPQAHPAPQQHNNAHQPPPKKKDDQSHN
jgi:hypothetical protein